VHLYHFPFYECKKKERKSIQLFTQINGKSHEVSRKQFHVLPSPTNVNYSEVIDEDESKANAINPLPLITGDDLNKMNLIN
jgi:hypothetical protein